MRITTHHHGTQVTSYDTNLTTNNGDGIVFSVASFNLLAPLYIRPVDRRSGKVQSFASFDWISVEDSEKVLGNNVRLPKLLQSMKHCGCDFICVQELQLERADLVDIVEPSSESNGHVIEDRFDTSSRARFACQLPHVGKRPFVLPQWIHPLLHPNDTSSAYSVILPEISELEKIAERNQRVLQADIAVTNAIFFQPDKWKPMPWSDQSFKNTITCVVQGFCPITLEDQLETSMPIDEKLSRKYTDPIVIASIHLDAMSEQKRVHQLQHCLEQSLSYFSRQAPPIVIAGDFNCELLRGSCIHAFLKDREGIENESTKDSSESFKNGQDSENHRIVEFHDKQKECAKALRLHLHAFPTEEQMKSWLELYETVTHFVDDNCLTLERVDTGCTRAAYDHEEDEVNCSVEVLEEEKTNPSLNSDLKRVIAQWRLDHILYTPFTLVPQEKWSTLEDDDYSCTVGLPNDRIPTDHLPIAASFRKLPHPKLTDDVRNSLIDTLKEMELKHDVQLLHLQSQNNIIQMELEQQHKEKIVVEEQHKKKSKKKQTVSPSPEIIDHIRKSRAEMKQLKAKHRIERMNFVKDRSMLERIEIYQYLNRTPLRMWAENGRS